MRWRGKNLVRVFGQSIGWTTHSIEIKNIVVGDLPFDGGRGDFYLSVESSTNPPMVTALQEEQLPKVVHFPEVIGLKIRDSVMEKRVKIVVKELNVLGSQDIAECHLSSTALIDWAASGYVEDRVKRFAMRPCDNSLERETPPWILLEFAEADDVRGVDTLPNANAEGLRMRTWVPTTDHTVTLSNAHPIATAAPPSGYDYNPGNHWKMQPRQNVDLDAAKFKGVYTLLDDAGNPIAEPLESELANIRRCRKCASFVFIVFQVAVWLAVIGWLIFRFYVWSCYRQFRWLTEARLRHHIFPIGTHDLKAVRQDCNYQFEGTGASTAARDILSPTARACRPEDLEVLQTCQALPPGQPRPRAFESLLEDQFGIDLQGGSLSWLGIKHGPSCFEGICEWRDNLYNYYDKWAFLFLVVLLLSTFVVRWAMNNCVKHLKREHQKGMSAHLRQRNNVNRFF